MEKFFFIYMAAIILSACNNNAGESGTVDDGIKTLDANGALQDTAPLQPSPSIDTAHNDHRVDTEKRDTTP
jgi:hypothetical protein